MSTVESSAPVSGADGVLTFQDIILRLQRYWADLG